MIRIKNILIFFVSVILIIVIYPIITTFADDTKDLYGVALKDKTHVYEETSQKSIKLKSYDKGSILKYKKHDDNWYKATVKVNGNWQSGYINHKDVETATNDQKILHGIALKSPTNVYKNASTSFSSWKSYSQGTKLKFKIYTDQWYEATVKVNGEWKTGYIHKDHIEIPVSKQETLHGFALNNTTTIYKKPSTTSGSWKSYKKGSALKYKTFLNNWYEATVKANGDWQTGYIHKDHVEIPTNKQETLNGVALKSPTKVYKSPSSSSGTWKSYKKGSSLKYKTYLNNWYEATVRVNGNWETGYIAKSDVEIKSNDGNGSDGNQNNKTTNYGITLNKALDIQSAQETVITDIYSSSPAYVQSKNIELTGKGVVSDSVVNIRTAPDTTKNNVAFQLFSGDPIQIIGEKTGSAFNGSTLWYKILHNNKEYYIHSKLASGTEGIVKSNNIHVRQSQSSSSHSFGQLKKGTKVTIVSQGSSWHEIKYNTWRRPTTSDMKKYLDPNNHSEYQHLRLDSSIGVSASELNKILNGKGTLSGKAQSFINATEKHGVNEAYLISHALLETGNGNSTLAKGVQYKGKTVYNMFGIGAIDSDPLNGGAKTAYENGWFSPEQAIEGGAKWIRGQYIHNQDKQNTLYKMKWNPNMNNGRAWKQYATDIGWAIKQTPRIENIYKEVKNPVKTIDKVTYK